MVAWWYSRYHCSFPAPGSHLIHDIFPPHIQCSKDRLQIPDQDEVATQDEGMNA